MRAVPLPNSVSSLTDRLHVLEFHWHGVGLQFPNLPYMLVCPTQLSPASYNVTTGKSPSWNLAATPCLFSTH